MKNITHYLLVSFILILLSFIMFFIHYLVFGQLENTIYYSFMSLCFIPINILVVTLVFEKLVERRTKLERLSKLNMLVGLFFSDIGFTLLEIIVAGDANIQYLNLDFTDLKTSNNKLKSYEHIIVFEKINYPRLEKLVLESRDILSNLISNENILEHETFADLLMSLMHLRDEIIFLQYKTLTDDDSPHIKGDICRVYKALTSQWINYLSHLKKFYPYQYNGAIKFNPFTVTSK
ncbi:hypothetical protein [Clostridium beijerinckii]|uniref:hypothetical protein n=1 Tax=Clostridium beijerinckii TaxID=1520 RepID=UPI00156ECD2B|nr:hypothetical protein [Clostridium beijerinckii]NRT70440.1 hypothetical protein [Clostridium beijerinckii]